MPKKRTTRKPHRNGLHAVPPLATMPPAVALRSLSRDFAAWAVEEVEVADGSSVDELLTDLTSVVEVAVHHAGLKNLFAWTPSQVTATLRAVLDDDVLDLDDPEQALRVASSLHTLFDHLAETDRWAASDGALEAADEAIHEVLEEHEDDLDAPGPWELAAATEMLTVLTAVERDPAAEAAALRALPIVADVEALLRWLGASRPLTSTGALRPVDVAGAAAAVGIDLGGQRPRSMWDVKGLERVWVVAEEAWLLEVTRTRVVLTDLARDWLAADPDEPAPASPGEEADPVTAGRAAVALGLIGHLVAQDGVSPGAPPPALALIPWLTAAAGGEPVELEDPDALLAGLLSLTEESGPGDVLDPEEVPGALGTIAALSARRALDALVVEGVLQLDEAASTFTITPGLEHLVATVAASEIIGGLGFDPEDIEVEGGRASQL